MTPRQQLFRKFPKIETENFVLRKLGIYDLDHLSELFNSNHTQKFQSILKYSTFDLINYIDSQNQTFNNHEIVKWVIERKVDGEFIGIRILYCDDDSGWVEIQGDTKYEFWNKGYTKEVYIAIINTLKTYKFKGVRSIIQISNINAKCLLKSLGFKLFKTYNSNDITFQEYHLKLNTNFMDYLLEIFN